jgi:2-keto-4-pentenoate hydratase
MSTADDVKVSGEAAPALRAARMLVAARRERRLIERLPLDCRPGDLAAGYAVQAQVAGMLGATGGWKIGAADPGNTPLHAPIFAQEIHPSGVTLAAKEFTGAIIEAEIAFRLLQDLRVGDVAHDAASVARAVERVPALEIYRSRYREPGAAEEAEQLADCLANGGLIVGVGVGVGVGVESVMAGGAMPAWDIDLAVDDTLKQVRAARHPAGDPLQLVVWLANHLNRCGGLLSAGQVVTTGAMLLAPIGRSVRGEWQGLGSVSASFT